jgi:hypothetical protein
MNEDEKASETPVVEGDAASLEKLLNAVFDVAGLETARIIHVSEAEIMGAIERTQARLSRREVIRQANIERIIRLAAEEVLLSPSDAKIPVDRGWLIRFFDYAQDACHEVEQQTWARILAGEVADPGSFARRTLAFLNSMDTWELEGFIEYCAFSFTFESGWRFMFDEETAHREMWAYGRDLDLTQHFVGIGLLSGEINRVKPASAKGLRIRYRDRTYELRGSDSSSPEAGFAYRKFTVTGQQLAGILRTKSFFGYVRNLVKALNTAYGAGFEQIDPPPEN